MSDIKLSKNYRVAAINDISGIGRCSLTVALPILSCMGIETSVLPTAVLSTHTGEFTGYTFKDLTDQMMPIATHWESLGLHFDAVYTGYFGSREQLKIAEEIFKMLADEDTLCFVDPVMADNGELYANFDRAFVKEMRKYCRKADIILPNLTEACLLSDMEYRDGTVCASYVEGVLKAAADIGAKKVVMTGVRLEDGYGLAAIDSATGKISYALAAPVDGIFYGAGDTLASVLLGKYLKCGDLKNAAEFALDFTHKCIELTKAAGTERKYGLVFEPLLGGLCGQEAT